MACVITKIGPKLRYKIEIKTSISEKKHLSLTFLILHKCCNNIFGTHINNIFGIQYGN